jgi:hypothetical protein
MSLSVTTKRLDDEASAALDNLRYFSRRGFHCFEALSGAT